MDFSQPTGFYPNGFPNSGHPYAFSPPTSFQVNGYTDIIGEGNVTSIISPDGSTQFLFMPTAQWPRPYFRNTNPSNFNNPYFNHWGTWLIRSIYNPASVFSAALYINNIFMVHESNASATLQPTMFNQPYQTPYELQNPRGSNSDCYLNLPVQGFAVKFHNDNCTSTSDIHYFYPKQYDSLQKTKVCAAAQVRAPIGEFTCAKPCNCAPVHNCRCVNRNKGNVKCVCVKKSHSSNSAMSIEESKSDLTCNKKGNAKKSRTLKRTNSKSIPNCEHKERPSSDKCVTTFTEQASSCAPENGRETQTGLSQSCCIPVHEVKSRDFICTAEIWAPKTPLSKKAIAIKSSDDLCCSRNYTSNSETE